MLEKEFVNKCQQKLYNIKNISLAYTVFVMSDVVSYDGAGSNCAQSSDAEQIIYCRVIVDQLIANLKTTLQIYPARTAVP